MEVLEVLKETYKRSTVRSLIIAIILIIFGVLLISNPEIVLKTVVIISEIAIILDGVIRIILYFRKSNSDRAVSMDLIFGIVECIIGIYFIINSKRIISMYYILLGIWIIIESVLKMQAILNLKEYFSNISITLIFSVVNIMLGLFIVLHPYDVSMSVAVATGIILVISESLNLIESIYTLVQIRKIEKNH